MKKLFTTLAITVSICLGVSAQVHYSDTAYFSPCQAATNGITPHIGTVPGLSPSDSALPCGVTGQPISDTIYFKNFTSFSGLNVNYLKIDSIYLPTGLCWSTNKASNQFTGGEDGVILIEGTTHMPQGQYKLRIIIDANAGPGGIVNLTNQDAETLAHLRYRIRLVNPGNTCPALNTTDTTDAFIGYTIGINEVSENISDLSVSPNPFSGNTTVIFNSEGEGIYIVKMTNLIGAVISTMEVSIANGRNEFNISSNGLSSGLYLLSISNGNSSVTKKVIVE